MTRYFLDPKNRRGELRVTTNCIWVTRGGEYGCRAAEVLTGSNGFLWEPWSAFRQQQQTALLPWEV